VYPHPAQQFKKQNKNNFRKKQNKAQTKNKGQKGKTVPVWGLTPVGGWRGGYKERVQ
jgi:hypothetical protein